MNTQPIRCLDTEESSELRCVDLVWRLAGKFMKAGGGPIQAELLQTGATKPRASTLARNAEVVELWNSGLHSVARISEKMKICPFHVSSILDRAGVRVAKRRRPDLTQGGKDFVVDGLGKKGTSKAV